MNRFTPYAAVVLRVAVGLIFLHHGLMKVHMGVGGVAGFFHNVGIPFATFAVRGDPPSTPSVLSSSTVCWGRGWAGHGGARGAGPPRPEPLRQGGSVLR